MLLKTQSVSEAVNGYHPTPPARRPTTALAIVTAVLLIDAASRSLHIASLTMNWDEVWSIWQTFGSPADIIRWTPTDWPPLYFLFVGAWQAYAGIQPLALRVSSLLAAMLGAAFTYRAGRRLGGERVGLFAALIYGALGFSIFLTLLVRAYTFLLALTPLIIWLTIRYFDHPSIRRGLVLAAACVALWFLHYTAAFVFLLIGLITLIKYGCAIWRWWLPGGIVALVVVITVLSKSDIFATRTGYNATIPLPPLPQALAQVYGAFTYPAALIWLALFGVAGALLVRARRRQAVSFLIWLAGPVAVYFLNSRLGLFQDVRYLWWAVFGLIFWLALGLALLPRRAIQLGAGVVIAGVALMPFQINDFQASEYRTFAPIDTEFAQLQQVLQPGDVVLLDPNCGCAPDEVWDYYMKIYFPNGLPFVKSAAGYRRVWYVSVDWLDDPATKASVEQGRVAEKYFGPPNFLIRLYEAPPDPVGILYPNGMRFHGAEIERTSTPDGPIYHEGETVTVRFWWSVDHPVALDYSLLLYVAGSSGDAMVNGPRILPTRRMRPATGKPGAST